MSTEKHDPWALLREAHSFVDPYEGDLFERIHAALAEHDAVPPSEEKVDSATPVVEWKTDAFGLDYHRQGNMLLMVVQTLDGNWGWETRVEGYAATEAKAKSAAIVAARG